MKDRFNKLADIKYALLLAGSFASAYVQAQTANCYTPVSSYSAGNNPYSLASSDFNGDGKKDIVTTNFLDNNFSLLLGTGTGSFSLPAATATGSNPIDIVIDDFNSDGKKDVAVVDMSSSDLLIYMGNGNGGFGLPIAKALPNGSYPIAVTSGDLNNDGKKDLVVGYNGNAVIDALIGSGTGNFASPVTFSTSWTVSDVLIADFNSDGFADIAASVPSNYCVDILLGNGTGSFITYTSAPAGSTVVTTHLSARDFNQDGKLDILVSNCSGTGTGNKVSFLCGLGNGAFMSPMLIYLPAGYAGCQTEANDFNNDGFIDFAVACISNNSNRLAVFVASAPLTFYPPIFYNAANNPGGLIFDDFTGDGMADIAISNRYSTTVQLFENNYAPLTISGSNTVCSGSSVTLTASGASSYTWDTGANTSSILAAPGTNTSYNVYCTSVSGCTNSAVISLTVVNCVGLAEYTNEVNSLIVYPNPFTNQLHIQTTNQNPGSILIIYDLSGRELKKLQIEADGRIEVDRQELDRGLYIYKIIKDKKALGGGKIIAE